MVMIRPVQRNDKPEWLRLRCSLWPHHESNELEIELEEMLLQLDRQPVFVAEASSGRLCGLIEISIRERAEGCQPGAVGYIEAWYVDPTWRRRGIGRMLVEAAEAWAISQGCSEMASDTTPNYPLSESAHHGLGYEEVRHTIHYRKRLR
jgi:aminoglycoside 6'-N-acetyltransferase I